MVETLLGYTPTDIKDIMYAYAYRVVEEPVLESRIEDCIPEKYQTGARDFKSDSEEEQCINNMVIKIFEENDQKTIKNLIQHIFIHSFGYTEWIDGDDEIEDLTDSEIVNFLNNLFKDIELDDCTMFDLMKDLNSCPFKQEVIDKIRENADEYY